MVILNFKYCSRAGKQKGGSNEPGRTPPKSARGCGLTHLESMIFIDFTADSQRPPKCGAHPGMWDQLTIWFEKNHWISSEEDLASSRLWTSCSSRLVSMKLVPLSVRMRYGHPLRSMNIFKHARNAAVERSLTSSRCKALVFKHTKTQA